MDGLFGTSVLIITSFHSVSAWSSALQMPSTALKQSDPRTKLFGTSFPLATPSPRTKSRMTSAPFLVSPGWFPLSAEINFVSDIQRNWSEYHTFQSSEHLIRHEVVVRNTWLIFIRVVDDICTKVTWFNDNASQPERWYLLIQSQRKCYKKADCKSTSTYIRILYIYIPRTQILEAQ